MNLIVWAGFIAGVVTLLVVDLKLVHRNPHVISIREALAWTAFWIFLALLFNAGLYFAYESHWLGLGTGTFHVEDGKTAALQFLAGYLLEKALSADNVLVMAIIFSYFKVPHEYQHRTLFWGILGALVMRGVMIVAGVALIQRFEWVIYVFGAVLLLSAAKMMFMGDEEIEPERNPAVRLARRFFRITPGFERERFFAKLDGRAAVTPLFLVLLVIETTDLIFAVDSIPAVFGVTRDPFIVFSSNVFAILGLRSLYFAIAGAMVKFRYLKPALVILLAFVGVKMLLEHHVPISIQVSLAVIFALLTIGIVASIIAGPAKVQAPAAPQPPDGVRERAG